VVALTVVAWDDPSRICRQVKPQPPELAVVDAPVRASPGMSGAQRGSLRHFAKQGVSIRFKAKSNSHLSRARFVKTANRTAVARRALRGP
jgi:hypothetical protein